MTKAQLKRLASYLELLRLDIRIPDEFALRHLSERKQKKITLNFRNYIHSLNVIEHYVFSHIPEKNVKYAERPNFRITKDAFVLHNEIIKEREKISSSSKSKKSKKCDRPIMQLQKSEMKNLSSIAKSITSGISVNSY